MLHVHLARNLAADAVAVLRQAVPPSVRITAAPEEPQPVDCHVLVTGVVSHEEILHSPDLRAVIVPFAGPPATTVAVLRDYPAISLHNLHFNDSATAEFTLALLLATAKWLIPADRLLRHGDWTCRGAEAPAALLWGKRVTILGYGAIGRRLAPVCRALGMQVVGVKRTVTETRDGAAEGMVRRGVYPRCLDQILAAQQQPGRLRAAQALAARVGNQIGAPAEMHIRHLQPFRRGVHQQRHTVLFRDRSKSLHAQRPGIARPRQHHHHRCPLVKRLPVFVNRAHIDKLPARPADGMIVDIARINR